MDALSKTLDKAIDSNTVCLIVMALIAWWVVAYSSVLTGPSGNILSAIVGALATYLTKELKTSPAA